MSKPAQRIEFNGQSKTAAEWGAEYDVSAAGIYSRLARGKNPDGSDPEGAEEKPAKTRRPRRAPEPVEGVEVAAAPEGELRGVDQILEVMGIEHMVLARTARGTTIFFPAS